MLASRTWWTPASSTWSWDRSPTTRRRSTCSPSGSCRRSSSLGVSSLLMRAWALALPFLLLPAMAAAQPCTESLTALFERVSPAVVSIQAMKINKVRPQRRFETIVGSGLIIDRGGEVLTNAHVVDGAASITITLDNGAKVNARVVGLDSVLDVALLRVDTTNPLPVAQLGDSGGVKVGDEVVAIGNPLGLDQTMTKG